MRVYTVGGNQVTVRKNSLSISDKLNERTTCGFVVIEPVFAITKGVEVTVEDDGIIVFAGKVFKPRSAGDKSKEISVSCTDYSILADKRIIAEAYDNILAGDIVRDFITKYFAAEGIVAGTIQDGPTISKAVFNYDDGNKAMGYLSDLSGFFWEIDKDKKLNFFDKSTYNAPFSLTDTSANYKNLAVEEDASEYRNRQYLRAGLDVSTTQTRTFKGDGETQVFAVELSIAEAPIVKVNGVTKTVGIRSLETGFDWYWSKNDKTVSQDTSGTKLTASDILTIEFKGLYPVIIVAESQEEIQSRQAIEGGSGVYENVLEETSLDTKDAALEYTDKLLEKYGFIPKVVSFDTYEAGLRAGQLLPVTNTQHNISGTFLINSVTARDDNGDTLYGVQCLDGSKLGGWEKFFKALVQSKKKFVIRENEILVSLSTFKDSFVNLQIEDTMTYVLHQYLICSTNLFCGPEVII